jgi:hypothetical protein
MDSSGQNGFASKIIFPLPAMNTTGLRTPHQDSIYTHLALADVAD